MSTSESERAQPIATDEAEVEWQQFQQVEFMANHWDRPGWTGGRRSYHWMLTFESAPEVRALAAACQAELADIETLDLVPLDYLHVTVQGLGFTDEVSVGEVDQIRATVERRAAQFGPFSLQIGPLAGSPGAVRLSATPHESARAVHRMILSAARSNGGVPGKRGRTAVPLVPHASVAYGNGCTPAAPIIDRVRSLRHLGFADVQVSAVQLVELRREVGSYRWDLLASVALSKS